MAYDEGGKADRRVGGISVIDFGLKEDKLKSFRMEEKGKKFNRMEAL